MKRIHFINNSDKKKIPAEKKFFYSVIAICILVFVIASYISTYDDSTQKPKSPTAKEVVKPAPNNDKV